MKNGMLVALGVTVLTAGCANESPLMFVSKTTIGVEVATPNAGASEANFSIGFKAIDTAYVPVVEIVDSGKSVHVVSSSNLTSSTPVDQGEVLKALEESKQPLAQSINEVAQQIAATAKEINSAPQERQSALFERLRSQQATLGALSRAYDNLPGRRDALSVFSVIDSNSFARSSEAGVGVGKIFATGVAAQTVAEHYRTPYGACSGEIVNASVALQKLEDEEQQALGKSLAAICSKRK